MLNRIFSNKAETPAAPESTSETEFQEPVLPVDGKPMTRADCEKLRRSSLELLATEKDPKKQWELSKAIAQFDSVLEAFDRIRKAWDQAEPFRAKIRREEEEVADLERARFVGFCDEISVVMLERVTGRKWCAGAAGENAHYFRQARDIYLQQLHEQLRYSDAEKQLREIRCAEVEGRDWKDIVSLPSPDYLPPLADKIFIRPRTGREAIRIGNRETTMITPLGGCLS